jgi:hypothetical protein
MELTFLGASPPRVTICQAGDRLSKELAKCRIASQAGTATARKVAAEMNSRGFEIVWGVIDAGLRGVGVEDGARVLEDIYIEDVDLSAAVEEKLVSYIGSQSRDDLSEVVAELVRRFDLVGFDPITHLLAIGFLIANHQIVVQEAVHLAQVSREHFSRSQKDGVSVVEAAERVKEEENIGFLRMDEDHYFEEELAAFCRGRGYRF